MGKYWKKDGVESLGQKAQSQKPGECVDTRGERKNGYRKTGIIFNVSKITAFHENGGRIIYFPASLKQTDPCHGAGTGRAVI